MLSQIYLEDRINEQRSEELIKKIANNVQTPNWSDQYILALNARNKAEPFALNMARKLSAGIPDSDPRQQVLQNSFPELSAPA
jgi:hypothetical protein